jgi:ectoine hydroxylase-related dioxygenase (phytanoyl-CoA dioxygenase family)
MAPFDTSKMITFWIGLQNVPHPDDGGTGLLFVDGSHNDFALPYWNGLQGTEYDRLEDRYNNNISHHMPLEVGDVTVHNGWTLHCAGAADMLERDRYAIALSYVDGGAEVRENVLEVDRSTSTVIGDKEDVWSFRSWVGEVKPRSQFRHPSVPIVWPLDKRDHSID